ncbi:hypothetical protein CLAIMM_02192, partial [Cladophialophora immunda]
MDFGEVKTRRWVYWNSQLSAAEQGYIQVLTPCASVPALSYILVSLAFPDRVTGESVQDIDDEADPVSQSPLLSHDVQVRGSGSIQRLSKAAVLVGVVESYSLPGVQLDKGL